MIQEFIRPNFLEAKDLENVIEKRKQEETEETVQWIEPVLNLTNEGGNWTLNHGIYADPGELQKKYFEEKITGQEN